MWKIPARKNWQGKENNNKNNKTMLCVVQVATYLRAIFYIPSLCDVLLHCILYAA